MFGLDLNSSHLVSRCTMAENTVSESTPLMQLKLGSSKEREEVIERYWRPIFEEFSQVQADGTGCCDGCTLAVVGSDLQMPLDTLRVLLGDKDPDVSEKNQERKDKLKSVIVTIPQDVKEAIVKKGESDGDDWIEFGEFKKVLLNSDVDLSKSTKKLEGMKKYMEQYVNDMFPNYYHENYCRCRPPPIFIPLVTIIEIAVFIYYCVTMNQCSANRPVPIQSPLIYDPSRRYEAWRFLTYMFLHAGLVHIIGNLLIQILIGIPLELVHNGWRVCLVYVFGSLIGAFAHSLTDPRTFLLGASGGVYALFGAHVANVVLNFENMQFPTKLLPGKKFHCGIVRTVVLGILVVADFGWALYQRYGTDIESNVGFMAHVGGFLGGLFLGNIFLKNLTVREWEKKCVLPVSIIVISLIVVVSVVFNATFKGFPATNWMNLGDYMEQRFG